MLRFFEEKNVAEMYKKHRISTPNFIAEELIKWMQEEEVELDTAVDVGCGSGQHTFAIAPHFRRVRAFDISVEQIEEAKRHPAPDNVSFEVSPAEKLPLDDHSVQLVTGGCSFHWFDLETFYAEVDRVLVPNGTVAAVIVHPVPAVVHDPKGRELSELIKTFHSQHSFLSKHERIVKYCADLYANLPMPYKDEKRILETVHEVQECLEFLLGTLNGIIANALDSETVATLLDSFSKEFLNVLGLDANTPPNEVPLTFRYTCSLILCRKPGLSAPHGD